MWMNGTESHVAGTRNAGELKAGVDGQLSESLSVNLSVAQQMGGKGCKQHRRDAGHEGPLLTDAA
ncbi:autotransporter outer membrane beta-barrel domain-containing protein [Pantoea agglomerans]|uniref:autotransporter outer membrane beta-barrel domain-containing protein n=1 Tax=Enterobacter agglomerans TaxID=549 RepID=UPI002413CCA6|nr:autotransporter outer membrane beta-barrel domain-containing protein [Pantoea agglomerans]